MSASNNANSGIDLDGDGIVSDTEMQIFERKMRAQRRMATYSLVAMVGFTALLFSPIISVEKVQALNGIIDMFYVSLATVVGAYMGASAWMGRK